MADLDVSDILLSPEFADELTITRREQSVSAKGRVQIVPTVITPKPWGVVLPQSDAPIQRGPEQQNLPRLLEVHTQYRLRGPSKDPVTGQEYQPDIITLPDGEFVVNKVHDFSRFGQGFIRADLSSRMATEAPPE